MGSDHRSILENLVAALRARGDSSQRREAASAIDKLRSLLGPSIPPQPQQTVGVALSHQKVAALLFDRIWGYPSGGVANIPNEIIVYGDSDFELILATLLATSKDDSLVARLVNVVEPTEVGDRLLSRNAVARSIAEDLARQFAVPTAPLYADRNEFGSDYASGTYGTIMAVLNDVALVDNDRLTWQQVIEFRHDKNAKRAYRRFVRWLDADMAGRPRDAILDEVAVRLQQYEVALRKHGIETAVGSIEAVMDPKFIAAAAGLAGVLSLSGASLAAFAAASSLVVGRATCSAVRGALNIAEHRANASAEVAFIHEIKRL